MDILNLLSDYSELGMSICFSGGMLMIVFIFLKMREDQKIIKATLAAIVAFVTTGRQIEHKPKSNKVEVLPKKKRGRPRKEK